MLPALALVTEKKRASVRSVRGSLCRRINGASAQHSLSQRPSRIIRVPYQCPALHPDLFVKQAEVGRLAVAFSYHSRALV